MTERTPLTGLVLVGGASERFGAPKALARYRGETLATRATRLLAEVCDEVLVVGKRADGLPFDVVDDGTRSRAPVHGVVAGLRHARHDVVVLPVDVPLDDTGRASGARRGRRRAVGADPASGRLPAGAPSRAGGAGRRGRAVASRGQPEDARASGRAARRRGYAGSAGGARAAWPRARRRRRPGCSPS